MKSQHALAKILALLVLIPASPAMADWHKAESDNFVVYADDDADDVQEFAVALEKYHSAMVRLTGRDPGKPSPSNRVTIFAVGGEDEIEELAGSSSIAGFYVPRASGSVAFVQDIRMSSRATPFSTIVLLHEYAHHFLISTSRYAMPRWLSEGTAEFFASARFPKDGTVEIGRPANHRVMELSYADEVSVRELVDYDYYLAYRGQSFDAFYGRSWLLYHYLTFSPDRSGQLAAYWEAVASGTPSVKAAEQTFGDLEELDRLLDGYLLQRRMSFFPVQPDALSIGTVSVEKLSKGMDEIMPLKIRSKRGVTEEQAQELLPKVRKVADKFPNDAGVLSVLAEAEYDAGNNTEAIDAADRAIAIDPSIPNAYVQKGYALFRMAREAEDTEAAYNNAMKPFVALNALENDHTAPLIYFYRSYAERGAEPPETARHALERASQLAPFDHGLAMNVALMQAIEGKSELAMQSLAPIAANPHGGSMAKQAAKLLVVLESLPEGSAFQLAMLSDEDEEMTDAQETSESEPIEGAESADSQSDQSLEDDGLSPESTHSEPN